MMSSDISSSRFLLLFFAAFGYPILLEQIGLEEGQVNKKVDNTWEGWGGGGAVNKPLYIQDVLD